MSEEDSAQRAEDESFDLAVERQIDAGPEVVFDAFLDMYEKDRPDWIVESQLDLRPGGEWLVTFHPPGLEPFSEDRVITEVDRPRRLAYTMTASASDRRPSFDTTVLLSFDEQGPMTRVSITQRGFPTAETRDEFAAAWPDVLELLEDRASTS